MKHESLEIEAIKLITPEIFRDHRGFFSETFSLRALATVDGLADCGGFVQDNHSFSVEKGVIRGLHFQIPPHAQDKLIRVTRGSIYDVAVDIRMGSPTFGSYVGVVLSAENWRQLWVPKGFAHGFCTLEPRTEVLYKVTDYYDPECDMGLAWNDPELGIEWPLDTSEIVLSDKDAKQPRLSELQSYFSYSEVASESDGR